MRSLPFAILLLLVSTLSTAQTEPAQAVSASPGATALVPVKLRLTQTISSANARVGQAVLLEVIDPVEIDGKVIIAAGARARGTITRARKRGRNHREGQLQFTVWTVAEIDGSEARVLSATVQKGTGHGEPIFGPCTFPLPADPAGLFRKGPDVVIPKGTEMTFELTNLHS